MAEYIEKQAAIESALAAVPRDEYYDRQIEVFINLIPPADVRPVVRGRWELVSDPGEPWKYRCNQCGESTTSTCMGEPRYHYCPNCGADMKCGDAE